MRWSPPPTARAGATTSPSSCSASRRSRPPRRPTANRTPALARAPRARSRCAPRSRSPSATPPPRGRPAAARARAPRPPRPRAGAGACRARRRSGSRWASWWSWSARGCGWPRARCTSSARTTTPTSPSSRGCPTSCRWASTSTRPTTSRACRRARCRRRGVRRSSTTRCARRTTPTTSCGGSSEVSCDERPKTASLAGSLGMSARNRELMALIPAALLVTAGFTAVFVQRNDLLSNVSLTVGAVYLGLCLAAHFVIRYTLPYADPYLFPLAALLACFGLVMIYRIDSDLAREQAQWFVFGLVLFAATIVAFREPSVLERYRYVIAAGGILLLMLPRVPGIGSQVNGAYLGIRLRPLSFQPAEFAKIAIVVFLASYLRDTRQMLVQGARRVLGVTIPPVKHFGPLLVVWGAAMVLLFVIRDIGSSLMFFGAFLALLYVATNRLSFVLAGLLLFALGAWGVTHAVSHVQDRIDSWLHPFDPTLYNKPIGGSYQLAQSLFAQADGGLFGKGFGQAEVTGGILPAPQTDLIYAVIVNELGLVGACGVLLTYLLVVERGFKTAMIARDSFSKLLASGLAAVFGLQVFVIVGGVTRVIPLTGVTLPFISYGGSSILANFVLLALLLIVSNKARQPV